MKVFWGLPSDDGGSPLVGWDVEVRKVSHAESHAELDLSGRKEWARASTQVPFAYL